MRSQTLMRYPNVQRVGSGTKADGEHLVPRKGTGCEERFADSKLNFSVGTHLIYSCLFSQPGGYGKQKLDEPLEVFRFVFVKKGPFVPEFGLPDEKPTMGQGHRYLCDILDPALEAALFEGVLCNSLRHSCRQRKG